jgi:hypothetical protein
MLFDYEFEFPGEVVQDEGPGYVLGVPITAELAAKHEAAMADIQQNERDADEEAVGLTLS